MKTIKAIPLLLLAALSLNGGASGQPEAAVATMIRNATFMERSPDFTDLYLIRTPDKGRQILIYCNSAACYKQRSQTLPV